MTTTSNSQRQFEVSVPLTANKRNRLFVRETSIDGIVSPVVPLEISSDQAAPVTHVDSPSDGATVFSTVVDVTGRVSDVLAGFAGLRVHVNGTVAEVNVGQGTNGTFIARGVTLEPDQVNTFEVLATDALGNEATVQASVFHQSPTGDTLRAIAGDGQLGNIQEILGAPLEAQLISATGEPLAGRLVTFEVVQNDGRLGGTPLTATRLSTTVPTDAMGIARASWRLGGTAGQGNQRVEATALGADGVATFRASAAPGLPSQINVAGGHNQRSQADGPAADRLSAWVNDGCNGVTNVSVEFRVVEGDAYLVAPGSSEPSSTRTESTDSTGHAQVQLVHGPEGGRAVVEANFSGNATRPAVFECVAMPVAPGKETTFTGLVLDNASRPIGGVVCVLHVGDVDYPSVTTETDGTFRVENIQDFGFADLSVNGRVATTLAGDPIPADSFPSLHFEMVVVPEASNSLGMPILLPELIPANERAYSTTNDTVLEIAGVEGLRMTVRAGSMSIDGSPAPDGTTLSLNEVRAADIPMPLPNGAATPLAWTLQPGGALFDPPIEIDYPNFAGLPAGAVAYILSFDHDTGRFEIVATGHVVTDGSIIRSDAGSGLAVAGWGGVCPPYEITGSGESCTVTIVNPAAQCVMPGEEIEFTAAAMPPGGDFTWLGGTAVGASDGAVYRATFEEGSTSSVVCIYTKDDVTAADSVLAVTAADDIVLEAKLGDIVVVDASGSGLENLTFASMESTVGRAYDQGPDGRTLSEGSQFIFRPTAEGTDSITLTGTCAGSPAGAEPMEFDVTLTVVDGYSTSGPDRVTFGTTPLDLFRQQQRLHYLGFRSADGNELTVDGVVGARTRQAIGLFCAVVSDGNSTAQRASFTQTGQDFINADNAPRWLRLENIPNGYQFSGNAERWASSWMEEMLIGAAATHQPPATFRINDLSRSGGGYLSPHSTHRAGMDMDVEEPTTTDSSLAPWFQHHGDTSRIVVATGAGMSGTNVVEGDLIQRFVGGVWETSAIAHGAAVPPNWARTTSLQLVGSMARNSAAYASGLPVKRSNYDRDELKDQFTALFAAQPASGASCGQVYWNDPFFYDGDSNIPGQNIIFVSGHGGHYHVDVAPPANAVSSNLTARQDGLAASLDQFAAEQRSQFPDLNKGIVDSTALEGDWSVNVFGATTSVRQDGSFSIANITLQDRFGPGGQATAPDGVSDMFVRLEGARAAEEGPPLYVVGAPFRLNADEVRLIGDLTISPNPPLTPESISLDLSTVIFSSIGETTIAAVSAQLTDGTTVDATGLDNFSFYSTSNPAIISVDEDGLVTARGNGVAYLRASNQGATSSRLLTVAGGDPLTTVIGTVVDESGNPVEECSVQASGFAPVALTNSQGQFILEGIPTVIQATLTVTATKVVGTTTLTGSLSGITPEPGGTTDAGTITVAAQSCGFDSDFGVPLGLADNDFVSVSFDPAFSFPFFGSTYLDCFVGSNGYISFGAGDTIFGFNQFALLETLPRISPAASNFDPTAGGSIHAKALPDRVVVTWNSVAENLTGRANTFQVQMFSTGRILFIYNGMESIEPETALIVAVTPGSNSTNTIEVDYTAVGLPNQGVGEVIYERFRRFQPPAFLGGDLNAFDLDQQCVEWLPNTAGGMDVEVRSSLTARYTNGSLDVLLPAPSSVGEAAADLSLEIISSSGLRWRKPVQNASARRSAFSHLPIPGSYRVHLMDGDQVLATGQANLLKRGERAPLTLHSRDLSDN